LIVIPAIDIIDGQCVRLYKGDYDKKTVYGSDPIEAALKWQSEGASWVHIIDLDGAKKGAPVNLKIVSNIKKSTGLKIEYGGGIRDSNSAGKCIEAGVDKIILGTAALKDFEFFSRVYIESDGKAIISLDSSESGRILTEGWTKSIEISLADFALRLRKTGCNEAIITDVSRDGTLEGINIKKIKDFLAKTGLGIFVAGGVTNIEDILKLKEIENMGVKGVIIGKALYENTIDLQAALQASGEKLN